MMNNYILNPADYLHITYLIEYRSEIIFYLINFRPKVSGLKDPYIHTGVNGIGVVSQLKLLL
jgi:hypothetical protein